MCDLLPVRVHFAVQIQLVTNLTILNLAQVVRHSMVFLTQLNLLLQGSMHYRAGRSPTFWDLGGLAIQQ